MTERDAHGTWTAIYSRFDGRRHEEEEHYSLDDVLDFFYWGVGGEHLDPLQVISPGGEVLEGEELYEAVDRYGRRYEQP